MISVAAMLTLLALVDTSTPVPFGSGTRAVGDLLWGAIALDGVILAVLGWLGWSAARAGREAQAGGPPAPRWTVIPPTPADRTLARFLFGLGVLFAAGAVVYQAGALLPSTQSAFTHLPFVTNSVVKVGTLALVAFYVARDIGPRIGVTGILFVAHVVSVLTQLWFWLGAAGEPPMLLGGREVAVRSVLLGGAALDAGIAALILLVWRRAYRARFEPKVLSLGAYRTLIALADVLVHGPDEEVSPKQIAHNVDRYYRGIGSRRGRLANAIALTLVHFHPVLYLRPPFPELSAGERMEHLKRHFYRDVALKLIPNWWRNVVRGAIRVGKQLSYVGYYNDRAADPTVGYERFESRRRTQDLDLSPPVAHRLEVTTPGDVRRLQEEADVCVIGSGAAGAILAYRLAGAGSSVIVLERGRYVRPADFSDDEVEMIAQLYDDGVFQQTRDLNFTILQGSCVGGTTVVNNAVSFRPPEAVVRRWNDPWRWNAGVDYAGLNASAAAIEQWLPIATQAGAPLNPSGAEFLAGVQRLGLGPADLEVAPVNANIAKCLGCGYCNMGCKYGRKLSMLDTVLPWAQRDFGDRVRIFSQAPVTRIAGNGSNGRRADRVTARLPDGRELTIRAKKVVVAAGAIASSWILMQSKIGRGLPVGRGMSFNMGHALT
ncbi:MAG: FAD-dependent oxidoreductase, partial [Gemmatimonadales bacterium]